MASASCIDENHLMSSEEYVTDKNSLLSLQPCVFRKETGQVVGQRMEKVGEYCDNYGYDSNESTKALQPDRSPRIGSLSCRLRRYRCSLRSRQDCRYRLKPATQTENHLIYQLDNEQVEVEEYVFSPTPSLSASSVRPLFITDGNKLIGESSAQFLLLCPENELLRNAGEVGNSMWHESQLRKEADGLCSGGMGTVTGILPLPESRKQKRKIRQVLSERSSGSSSQKSQKVSKLQGSFNGMFLFCLGVGIGIMSMVLSNKEVEKLNSLLNHHDVIQGLQEELEMKDSSTVKQLVNKASESKELYRCIDIKQSIGSFPSHYSASHFITVTDGQNHHLLLKNGENSESMSKIEAELEAELERLEQNINTSSLERRASDLSELDPEMIANVVRGELRADIALEGQNDATSCSTSTAHVHHANHPVSPKELSLRLHEEIQLRLEERIKELERALLQSQRQVQLMEAERVYSRRTFTSSDFGSSSYLESPTPTEPSDALVHSLCLSLSGDAVNAYNEAYKEFMQMDKMEEENQTTPQDEETNEVWFSLVHHSQTWEEENRKAENPSSVIDYFEELTWEQKLMTKGSHHIFEDDEGDGDDIITDEEEKMLIQQIVEKMRQGSPVFTNLQRMLLSMDK